MRYLILLLPFSVSADWQSDYEFDAYRYEQRQRFYEEQYLEDERDQRERKREVKERWEEIWEEAHED